MKRAVYSLLLIFVLSCGGNPRQLDNPDGTFYFMKNGNLIDGALISVRDSSLIISPYRTMYDTSDANKSLPLRVSDIEFVEFGYHDNAGGGILGFIIGGLAGMGAGYGLADAHNSNGDYPMLPMLDCYAGAAAGTAAGCYLDKQGSRYYPYRKEDVTYLK